VFEIVNKNQGVFTDDDLSLLEAVASIAACAVENARLYTTTRVRAEEMGMLNEMNLALTATLDPAAVVRVALSLIRSFFRAAGTVLFQVDRSADELRSMRVLVGERLVEASVRLRLGEGIVGRVVGQRQPALIEDVQSDPCWTGDADLYVSQHLGHSARGAMVVPLLTPAGAIGVVVVTSSDPGVYGYREQRTLQTLAGTLAVALENARLFAAERAAHEQLRDLTDYLQTAREEERAHIAREIHDELGQMLTALKMDLSWLAKRLPADVRELEMKAEAMSDLIDDTIQTVRRVATELRPGLLDDLGLVAALEWQAQEFEQRTGIECALHLGDEDVRLDRDRTTAVFRIFQETLTNVARHAEATELSVTLSEDPGGLILAVEDNGKGISEDLATNPKSLGLIGMRERARALGGDVTFQGVANLGTTVTVRIPRTGGG
jgi:signal transduction histidine kinase